MVDAEFMVVGIGASAGGVQACQAFLEHVPADSGMAYVVILHLSPDYDSQLAEILRATARIPVTTVEGRVRVEPDRLSIWGEERVGSAFGSRNDGRIQLIQATQIELDTALVFGTENQRATIGRKRQRGSARPPSSHRGV